MKRLLFITCLLIGARSYAQDKGSGNPLHYEAVIKTDSTLKKDYLFEKSLDWMSRAFTSSKAVIQSQDKEAGFIIGRFSFATSLSAYAHINDYANIKISVKDGKIKYELYDFVNDEYGAVTEGEWQDSHTFGKGMRKRIYGNIQKDSKQQADTLIGSLNSYFTGLKQNNNW